MAKPEITVSILSWLLEDRLIKTLIDLPRSTSLPLALCLHVQGEEQILPGKKQEILDATSGFLVRDIYFTKGNNGAAKPRAELLKRSAKTKYVFMTDNDMVFQSGSIDRLYKFMEDPSNSNYGIVDLVHNYLLWHRQVDGTKVTCIPVDLENQTVVDVNLIGAGSMFMRKELCHKPIIDTNYHIGTWDFDLCLNVNKLGWKIATICDKDLIVVNDKTYRTKKYKAGKVFNRIRLDGLKLFESKWGFSSEFYPNNNSTKPKHKLPKSKNDETIIVTRAIYNKVGSSSGIGILNYQRINMMQKFFIGSLNNQTDMDYKLYIVTGSKSNEATKLIQSLNYGSINVEFIYTPGNMAKWENSVSISKNWGQEMDKGCPEDIARKSNHPLTPIMARLDNDDWVAPGWVAHMKYLTNNLKKDRFLINYQVIGQAQDGRLYRFFAPHNKKRCSPFLALVQKSNPRVGPYENTHLKMGQYFTEVFNIPPSYAFMVVHGGNRSNRLYKGDVFYGDYVFGNSCISDTNKSIYTNAESSCGIDDWKSRIVKSKQMILDKCLN